MCGRASLTKVEKEIEKRFEAKFYSKNLERYQTLPNYNIAPTHYHPVILSSDPKQLHLFRWGLIPHWAKDQSIGSKMINARIETVLEKPSFKNAIQHNRCLIPFDGFYEWQKKGKVKIPYRITLKDEGIFAVAGIWEKWLSPAGEMIYSFSVLTQSPNQLMSNIHDRMPAILLPEQEALWIDPKLNTKDALAMISPYPDDLLKAYTVSKRVNKVKENDADLLKAVKNNDPIQGTLF